MLSARAPQSYPSTARRGRLSRVPLSVVVLSIGFAGAEMLPAASQTVATPPQAAAGSPEAMQQRAQELEAARQQQKNAADLQAKLKADIAAIGQDRSKLNQQLIDIAAQVRGVENSIGDAEARLRALNSREQQIRLTLGSRRAEVVEVLAALQRAGRRTPPALLVTPEDALQSLRTAMLLGAVVPELRAPRRRTRRQSRPTGRASQGDRRRARPPCRQPRQDPRRPDTAGGADRRTAAQAGRDRKGHGGGKRAGHRARQAGRQLCRA